MARYLAYTTPARGHLYPILPTLLELRQRGHDVVVYTLASAAVEARQLGLEAHAVAPDIEARPMDDWRARTPLGALQASLRTFIDRARHDGPDLQRAIHAHRPDAVLVDINAWGALAVAEVAGLPWSTWCPYFLPVPSQDVPPFGLGLPPARNALGHLRDAVLRPAILGGYNRALPGLNRARRALGAPALRSVTDTYLRAPTMLYQTAEPFEYPRRDWHPSVQLVGPGLFELPSPPPAWLEAVQRPTVLVTCLTEYQNDGALVQATLDALAGEDVQVVATTAGVDPAGFHVSSNAVVERFLPHGHVLERADCVVCHGGMGITQKALAAGVPLVVVPFGRDQHEVARHVQEAGAGVRLAATALRPERLRAAIRTARTMRPAAARLADALRHAGGAARSADLLEQLSPAAAVSPGPDRPAPTTLAGT